MKAGAIDVIEKPIEMDALVATTAEALSARSRTVEASVECSGRDLISLNSPAARFAGYVLKACESHEDLKTLVTWAKFVGVSYPALSELCRLLRITPHDGRDFMRLLRATRLAEQSRLRIETFLDISDRRTLQRLLNRAGLDDASISVEAFTQRQSFIPRDAEAFQAVLAGIVKQSGSSKPN
jgi:AraC-like DNA-binding protein